MKIDTYIYTHTFKERGLTLEATRVKTGIYKTKGRGKSL